MSEKRRIIVNTLANGVAQFAALLAGLVFLRPLIAGFGTTNYGLYMLTSSVVGWASLLDFGVGGSLVKLTAEAVARDDRERLGRITSSALAFYTGVGVVIALIMVALAFNAATLFHGSASVPLTADGARLLRNLFFVAAGVSLLAWPANTGGAVLAGFQRYKDSAWVSLAVTIGVIGVTLAVILMHEGPIVLMLGSAVVSLAGGLANALLARSSLHGVKVSLLHADGTGIRAVFTIAWAIFISQLASIIIYQQTDRIVLGVFVSAAAITIYEAAGKFQGLMTQLTSFSISAVMPMASQLDAQGRVSALRTLFLRGTKYSLALLTPIVVVLIVVARPLLQTWLGSVFTPPVIALQALSAQILISHQLLTSGTAVGDTVMIGLGKLPKRLPYLAGLAIMNLVLSLILVRSMGILGVVLGTAIPWFIDYPLHMRLLLKTIGVPASRWLREVVLPTYPLLLVPLLASFALLATPLAGSLLGIAAIGMLSVVAYWGAVYALGFTPMEREEVRGAAAGMLARFRPRDV